MGRLHRLLHGADCAVAGHLPHALSCVGTRRRSLRYWRYRAAGGVYLRLRRRVICPRPVLGPALTFKDTTITFALIGYAFVFRAAAGYG